jgi:dTMP kinase
MGNPYSGRLIAVEGIDGSGKSSIVDEMTRWYDGLSVTQEPWTMRGHETAEDSESSPLSDFMTFVDDRVTHTENSLESRLRGGETVLCDRYILSTIAYQGPELADQLNMDLWDTVSWMLDVHEPWYIEPDHTIFCWCFEDEANQRNDGTETIRELREAASVYERLLDIEYVPEPRSTLPNVTVVDTQRNSVEDCVSAIEADIF